MPISFEQSVIKKLKILLNDEEEFTRLRDIFDHRKNPYDQDVETGIYYKITKVAAKGISTKSIKDLRTLYNLCMYSENGGK